MKTKTIILGLIMGACSTMGFSQDDSPSLATGTTYKTAIGLRGGETSGLTIKHFVGSQNAIKGILGVWRNGFSATVLWEHYENAFDVRGLNWYYGAGGHASVSGNRTFVRYDNDRFYQYSDGAFGLGVDGIVGLEYAIPKIPFAVSLDLKPYAEVVTNGNFWLSLDPGLGVKVTF